MLACILNKQTNRRSFRLFKLEPNAIFRYQYYEVMHEHLIHVSNLLLPGDINLNLKFNIVPGDGTSNGTELISFKRPSLYEFITQQEQKAVSSHYSIISLVPMLLEIGQRSRVLECGTGAGSMTMFLSERIGHAGHLDTFDVIEAKEKGALAKFNEWKSSFDLAANSELDKWPANVKFGTLNFVEHKFEQQAAYDAIYLDMIDMDRALWNAYQLLRHDGILVLNSMHLTQLIKCLNVIERNRKSLGLSLEIVIEPSNRLWEMRRIGRGSSSSKADEDAATTTNNNSSLDLNWTCRLEDRFAEKKKRGGLFFNYWQGYLAKFRKIF